MNFNFDNTKFAIPNIGGFFICLFTILRLENFFRNSTPSSNGGLRNPDILCHIRYRLPVPKDPLQSTLFCFQTEMIFYSASLIHRYQIKIKFARIHFRFSTVQTTRKDDAKLMCDFDRVVFIVRLCFRSVLFLFARKLARDINTADRLSPPRQALKFLNFARYPFRFSAHLLPPPLPHHFSRAGGRAAHQFPACHPSQFSACDLNACKRNDDLKRSF